MYYCHKNVRNMTTKTKSISIRYIPTYNKKLITVNKGNNLAKNLGHSDLTSN